MAPRHPFDPNMPLIMLVVLGALTFIVFTCAAAAIRLGHPACGY